MKLGGENFGLRYRIRNLILFWEAGRAKRAISPLPFCLFNVFGLPSSSSSAAAAFTENFQSRMLQI